MFYNLFYKKSEKTTSYHNAVKPDFPKYFCYHVFFRTIQNGLGQNGHFSFWGQNNDYKKPILPLVILPCILSKQKYRKKPVFVTTR